MRYITILFLAACSVNTCTSDLPPNTNDEWAIAQKKLEGYVGQSAYTVWPTMFNWEVFPGVFKCGEVDANGCFQSTTRTIQWNADTPTVIRHEAGHAILWKLGDKRWHCYEHVNGC